MSKIQHAAAEVVKTVETRKRLLDPKQLEQKLSDLESTQKLIKELSIKKAGAESLRNVATIDFENKENAFTNLKTKQKDLAKGIGCTRDALKAVAKHLGEAKELRDCIDILVKEEEVNNRHIRQGEKQCEELKIKAQEADLTYTNLSTELNKVSDQEKLLSAVVNDLKTKAEKPENYAQDLCDLLKPLLGAEIETLPKGSNTEFKIINNEDAAFKFGCFLKFLASKTNLGNVGRFNEVLTVESSKLKEIFEQMSKFAFAPEFMHSAAQRVLRSIEAEQDDARTKKASPPFKATLYTKYSAAHTLFESLKGEIAIDSMFFKCTEAEKPLMQLLSKELQKMGIVSASGNDKYVGPHKGDGAHGIFMTPENVNVVRLFMQAEFANLPHDTTDKQFNEHVECLLKTTDMPRSELSRDSVSILSEDKQEVYEVLSIMHTNFKDQPDAVPLSGYVDNSAAAAHDQNF